MRRARSISALALALGLGPAGAGCGDNRPGDLTDAAMPREASVDAFMSGTLFGEACVQPPFPEISTCHLGQGACHDEPEGPVCRPWCHIEGMPQCVLRGGVERVTDRGACVCVPP